MNRLPAEIRRLHMNLLRFTMAHENRTGPENTSKNIAEMVPHSYWRTPDTFATKNTASTNCTTALKLRGCKARHRNPAG
jgi:hypothetical protein